MELVEVLFTQEQVEEKIDKIAEQINKDFEGSDDIIVIGVLKGGVYFMTELTKRITLPIAIDFISASSYGDGTVSSGNVLITKEPDTYIEGKDVIIVEDIIDTGRTLS